MKNPLLEHTLPDRTPPSTRNPVMNDPNRSPRADRLILILRDYEDMSFEDIGHTLDLEEAEVRRRYASIHNQSRP